MFAGRRDPVPARSAETGARTGGVAHCLVRRLLALTALPLLVAALAGCGDDDGGEGASASASASLAVGGGSREAFCAGAVELESLNESAGAEPSAETFADTAVRLEALAEDAPAEVRADLEVVVEGFRRMGQIMGDLEGVDPEVGGDEAMAALEGIQSEMEDLDGRLEAASERIGTYLEEECGIDVDEGGE